MLCSRRTCVSLLALVVAHSASPKDARADFWGGDLAILTGILVEAIATAISTAETVTSLINQAKMLAQMIKTLDPKSWEDWRNLYQETRWTADAAMSGIEVLSYQMSELKNSWKRVYPTDYRPYDVGKMQALAERWNKETVNAAEVAARAQTSLGQLESIDKTANHVLDLSKTSTGQVEQLQAVAQMLGVVQRQLSIMIQTGSTEARLQANVAAAEASERAMAAERKRRNLDGYTRRGRAVSATVQESPVLSSRQELQIGGPRRSTSATTGTSNPRDLDRMAAEKGELRTVSTLSHGRGQKESEKQSAAPPKKHPVKP